jgi:hypothetical protein
MTMIKTTRAQRMAIYRLWNQEPASVRTKVPYRAFRESVTDGIGYLPSSIAVACCGVLISIESDGYTHR